MATRKELITKKYLELTAKLREYLAEDLFPNIDDMDIADLVFFFNLYFQGAPAGNYTQALTDILECKGVKLDTATFSAVLEIVTPFADWFNHLP
jgi:hypothetical protein